MSAEWNDPSWPRSLGGRCRRRKERHYGCTGIDLLGLIEVYLLALDARIKDQVRDRSRLLKLVIGVEISTRPARSFGSEGNATKSTSLRTAAAPKRPIFRRSRTMMANIYGSVLEHEISKEWCRIQDIRFP